MLIVLMALMGTAQADEAVRYGASRQVPQEEGLLLRWDPARSWGTSRLVQTLQDVSQRLAFEIPHADPLLIGDVSKRGGGRMFGHTTHHMGVDADIGLFVGTGEQPLGGFLDVRARDLDLAANWALIRALLDDEHVAFILLDQAHIDRLKAYVIDEVGLDQQTADAIFPPADTRLSWESTGVVRHAPNHRSHLHVRVGNKPGT